MKRKMRSTGLTLALFCCCFAFSWAEETPAPRHGAMTAEEIVQKLGEMNEQRAASLKGYVSRRIYNLRYKGSLGQREAQLVVDVFYESPSTKTYSILSQSGSKFLVDRVFRKLLNSEQEALEEENRRQTEMSRRNYEFEFAGEETSERGHFYTLRLKPRVNNKFLYVGTIRVDANEFAIASIDAEPAKNPSFWMNNTHIEHQYKKVGDFWLPHQNRSTSHVRLGGSADLTIDYVSYRVNEAPSPAMISGNTQ
jgi:hypothetical protein